MSRIIALLIFAFVASACATPPIAAPGPTLSGDAARGLAYAQENCAACHAVAANENWSSDYGAPAFVTIANTPGMSPVALNAWLHTSHPNMPNLIVEPDRIDDVSAYLATLRSNAAHAGG